MNERASRCHSEILTIGTALLVGTLGAALFMILPGLIGVFKNSYGFSDTQLGYLSSGHLGGLTLGSALGGLAIENWGVRRVATASLAVAAAFNAIATPAHAYGLLLCLMAATGLAAGMLIAVCFVVLGQSSQVDRAFSFYNVTQLLFSAIVLKSMPLLSNRLGVGGVFALLAILLALSLLSPRYLPIGTKPRSHVAPGFSGRPGVWAWMVLVSILMYFVGQGAVWTYLELIGERHGLSEASVANAVALSSVAGIVGALGAATLASRFGRGVPLIGGLSVTIASLYLLGTPASLGFFVLAASLFNGAWNFTGPYLPGLIASNDASGRVMDWAAFATLAGVAIGPFVGALLTDRTTLQGVLWVCLVCCVLTLLTAIPAWRAQRYA